MHIIYKICPALLWRKRRKGRILRRCAHRRPRWVPPFFHGKTGPRDGREALRRPERSPADRHRCRLARSTPCAMSPRAAAICFRISMRPLPLSAVLWVKPLPLGTDGRHVFPDLDRMIGSLFSLAKPALHALDAETAHQLTIRALSLMPGRAAADGRSRAWPSTCSAGTSPIPSVLRRASTSNAKCPISFSASASASSNSAASCRSRRRAIRARGCSGWRGTRP